MTEAGVVTLEVPAVRAIGPGMRLAGKVFSGGDCPGIDGCWVGEEGDFGVNSLRIFAADSVFGVGFRPFKDCKQSPVHQSQNTKERRTDKCKDDGHGRRKEGEQALNASQEGVAGMWVLSHV
jgi:hypothetical protein